jgi:hypothetical protein
MLGLIEALAEIERFSGQPDPAIPDEVKLSDIDALREVAETLRAGGVMARVRDAKLTGDHELVSAIRRSGSNIQVRERAFVQVFGQEVAIGERVTNLPLMQIKEVRRTGSRPDDPWEVVLIPAHADEVEVWMEFRPVAPPRTGAEDPAPYSNRPRLRNREAPKARARSARTFRGRPFWASGEILARAQGRTTRTASGAFDQRLDSVPEQLATRGLSWSAWM